MHISKKHRSPGYETGKGCGRKLRKNAGNRSWKLYLVTATLLTKLMKICGEGNSIRKDRNELGEKVLVVIDKNIVYESSVSKTPKRIQTYKISPDGAVILTEWFEGSTNRIIKNLSNGNIQKK